MGTLVVSLRCREQTLTADLHVRFPDSARSDLLKLRVGTILSYSARLVDYNRFLGLTAKDGEITLCPTEMYQCVQDLAMDDLCGFASGRKSMTSDLIKQDKSLSSRQLESNAHKAKSQLCISPAPTDCLKRLGGHMECMFDVSIGLGAGIQALAKQ